MVFCSNCGSQLTGTEKFCLQCGYDRGTIQNAQTEENKGISISGSSGDVIGVGVSGMGYLSRI